MTPSLLGFPVVNSISVVASVPPVVGVCYIPVVYESPVGPVFTDVLSAVSSLENLLLRLLLAFLMLKLFLLLISFLLNKRPSSHWPNISVSLNLLSTLFLPMFVLL
jgi:hypothetical protein